MTGMTKQNGGNDAVHQQNTEAQLRTDNLESTLESSIAGSVRTNTSSGANGDVSTSSFAAESLPNQEQYNYKSSDGDYMLYYCKSENQSLKSDLPIPFCTLYGEFLYHLSNNFFLFLISIYNEWSIRLYVGGHGLFELSLGTVHKDGVEQYHWYVYLSPFSVLTLWGLGT